MTLNFVRICEGCTSFFSVCENKQESAHIVAFAAQGRFLDQRLFHCLIGRIIGACKVHADESSSETFAISRGQKSYGAQLAKLGMNGLSRGTERLVFSSESVESWGVETSQPTLCKLIGKVSVNVGPRGKSKLRRAHCLDKLNWKYFQFFFTIEDILQSSPNMFRFWIRVENVVWVW